MLQLLEMQEESHIQVHWEQPYYWEKWCWFVTIHLREDRRHINELDLKKIIKKLKVLNLEIAATKEMLKIASRSKPPFICIVPEKRKEITTEGGLNLKYNKNFLRILIKKLKKINLELVFS